MESSSPPLPRATQSPRLYAPPSKFGIYSPPYIGQRTVTYKLSIKTRICIAQNKQSKMSSNALYSGDSKHGWLNDWLIDWYRSWRGTVAGIVGSFCLILVHDLLAAVAVSVQVVSVVAILHGSHQLTTVEAAITHWKQTLHTQTHPRIQRNCYHSV